MELGNKDNMKQSKVSFLLTEEELQLLESVVYLEPFLVDVVDGAKLKDDKYEVEFSVYDLKDTLSALAYVAPDIESYMEKETLYQLYGKIESFVNRDFE